MKSLQDIIINLILGIGISAYLGFTSFHGGFFNPLIAANGSMVKNYSFNFGSPMLWIIVFNLVAIIALVLLEKKLSDKSKKILSVLAPIWTIATLLICLGMSLYN